MAFINSYHKGLIILTFFWFVSIANGQQQFTAFEISSTLFPDTKLEDADKRPLVKDVQTGISNFHFQAAYPVYNSPEEGRLLLTRVSYKQLSFSFNNDTLPVYQPENLHELGIDLIGRTRLSKDWTLTVRFKPVLGSDFESIDIDHFTYSGGIIFTKKVNERFSYSLGVVHNYDFGEPRVLPALLLNWTNGHNLKIDMIVPKQLKAIWTPLARLEVGFLAVISGNEYRIGDQITIRNDSFEKGRIKYSVTKAGPFLNYGITDNIYLNIQGGFTLKRRFQVFNDNDKEIENLDLENSPFITGGLQIRI